ncbi:RNA-dependent ATPase rok1 [Verticillium nonalfalfae]|uniref:ATP-dependent RNA helicase ROK1 n=1 Tax=Verticillium nonalfalfae TaxID=1051616 RepID=A0A3M9XY34_9PEZI|nr:RNA-dependent ATPase rok1 [Verticillium nonalfalfae]RNJ52914.1 RNA-dependent ATPase rok1 [Verticillium nonalfalfae]
MDILKVLSRGIKQAPKGAKTPGTSTSTSTVNLPSAGNRTNPQLFHDPVPAAPARGSKRKRAKHDVEPEPEAGHDTDLPDVDFFASKPDPAEDDSDVAAEPAPVKPAAVQASPIKPATLLSDDECRQILRSHRLKLTLLSSRRRKEPKVTKSKSNKKKKKVAVEVKDEPLQLHTQPLASFRDLQTVYAIAPKLAENLQQEAYKVPTEVQLGSLPILLRPTLAFGKVPERKEIGDSTKGVHFLAVAPTGSGKTISFLIPAIDGILQRRAARDDGPEHELQAIVVAPTRELVFQIVNEGRKLALGTGIKIAGMRKDLRLPHEEVERPAGDSQDDEATGEQDGEDADEAVLSDKDAEASDKEDSEASDKDAEASDKDAEASDKDAEASDKDASDEESEDGGEDTSKPVSKADILVTTPALLLHYLTKGSSKTHKTLSSVRSLILDEADVLLDPLFRDATTGVWSACTNPDLRISFWSATMGSNIETLVTEMLAEKASTSPLVRLVVGLKDTAVPNITHKLIYTASEQGKLLGLRQLLHPTSGDESGPPLRPPFIVFTQTIERASALAEELKYDIPLAAGGPARIAALHSGLTDAARAGIMRRFRAGEVWVLITTDVLARGVDFAGVNGIINYDIPGSTAAYVHRAGRTGRAGREGGVAVTFYTKEDIPFVKTVANVIAMSEKQAGKTGDAAGVQKWLLDALPDVSKDDRKKLKERGVESRRTGGAEAMITSQSGWERRRENNRKGAIEGSKLRKKQEKKKAGGEGEWGGIDD